MMKAMKSMYKAMSLLTMAVAVLLSSCQEESVPQGMDHDGLTAVISQLSGMYVSTPVGKASSRGTNHPGLKTIINLQEGSTLRLIATKGSDSTIKDYVVRTADGGSQSLYPCTINEVTGAVLSESKEPLYLADGTYTISAISPAHKYNKESKKIIIDNGESVIATNNAWTQTSQSTLVIAKGDKSKVILLNPLMQLTARMTFKIKGEAGSGVTSIAAMQDGIEIDRIKDTKEEISIGDSIPALMCSNYNRIYIKESNVIEQNDGSLWGEVCLLPIDNRSTPMAVILNLMVNGVPTQFTFSIVNKILYAGYSYNYTVTVKIKDNISVANWQETSWSTEVEGK